MKIVRREKLKKIVVIKLKNHLFHYIEDAKTVQTII